MGLHNSPLERGFYLTVKGLQAKKDTYATPCGKKSPRCTLVHVPGRLRNSPDNSLKQDYTNLEFYLGMSQQSTMLISSLIGR